jgi:predicted RNA-binding Zn-ribbon protein involved in translation (DUF1610 family)
MDAEHDRTCLRCGKPFPGGFVANHGGGRDKRYCTRKCFVSAWRAARRSKPPVWACPGCGKRTQLPFIPLTKPRLWYAFACPSCGHRPCRPEKTAE